MGRRLGCCMVIAALSTASACSDSAGNGPASGGATVPTAGATTSTTSEDPYAVPEVIDEAYVERVLTKLYEIDGEATRIIVREKELVREAAELLQTIYAPEELNAQLEGWSMIINNGQLSEFRSDPGPVLVRSVTVLEAGPSCIEASTVEDASPAATGTQEPYRNHLILRPAASGTSDVNPTRWVIANEQLDESSKGCGSY